MNYLILSFAFLLTLNSHSKDIPAPDFRLYEVQDGEVVLQTDENGSPRAYLIEALHYFQNENTISQIYKDKIIKEINRVIKEANLIHVQAWGENRMISFSPYGFRSNKFKRALMKLEDEERIVRKLDQTIDSLEMPDRMLLQCLLNIVQKKGAQRICRFAIDENIGKSDSYKIASDYNLATDSIDKIIENSVYSILKDHFHDEDSLNRTISQNIDFAKLKPFTYGLNTRGKKIQKRVNVNEVKSRLMARIKADISFLVNRVREIQNHLIHTVNTELDEKNKFSKNEIFSRLQEISESNVVVTNRVTRSLSQNLFKIYHSHLKSMNGNDLIRIKDEIQLSNLNQNDDTTIKETQLNTPHTEASHAQEL